MSRSHCIYCNKEITTRSSEHVIQNALGGLLESEDICCPECNNLVSRQIDLPFTTIFNPILGNIRNLAKSNKKNSTPSYTGTVHYQGEFYKADIKAGKVVCCQELNKKLKTNAAKLPLDIVSFDFNLDNNVFKNGMAKIAFNYALAKNVNFDLIKDRLHITKSDDNISNITYNYPLVPFMPLNPLDEYLELGTQTELYHNMILFSQGNTLWCYIDLFNTFQYYVMLSDKVPQNTHIYENYMQSIRKIDRTEPTLHIRKPKDIITYAQIYGVEPCMDLNEFQKRVNRAIMLKSLKEPMGNFIYDKINTIPLEYYLEISQTPLLSHLAQSMQLYIDTHSVLDEIGDECETIEQLNERNFRTVTINPNTNTVMSYPEAMIYCTHNNENAIRQYTMQKFQKLTQHLLEKKK